MPPGREREPAPTSMPSTPPGLCAACRHSRRIQTRTGSVFWLCERAATDPSFPRYPALPVLSCRGFEPVDATG
jgi:hypothetical protein